MDFLELFELASCHLCLEPSLHLEPGVVDHFLSRGAVLRLPLDDLSEKVSQLLRLELQHAVLLYQHVLQVPELQLLNVLEVAFLVEN